MRIDDASQLREIELNSPQLQGQTAECWLRLIRKQFPLEHRNTAYKPADPTKWYRVWEKYKKEHDQALYESEMQLKNAIQGIQQERGKLQSRIVENKYLPREPPKAGSGIHGRYRQSRGTRSAGGSSKLAFSAGSRTSTATSAGVIRKVKREAREYAHMRALSRPIMRRPLNQHVEAPPSMLEARRREALPDNVPKEPVPEPRLERTKLSAAELERNAALDAWNRRATVVFSDSEEDSGEDNEDHDPIFDDDEDHDPVFDEPRPAKPPAKPAAESSRHTASAGLSRSRPRPAASSQSSAIRSSNDQPAPPRPTPSSGTATRKPTSSSMMQKFGAKAVKKSPEKPRAPAPGPAPSASTEPARPVKRKGTDLFMKPKKRVH